MPPLDAITTKFVLHWGEMGTRWGINRTVAQIHALLYLSPEPLNAEEIARTLQVARSNVSTSLRELQGWGIVHVVHKLGDRRDYFASMDDVWEMFRVIMDERKKREADPTIEMLRECKRDAAGTKELSEHARQRIGQMLDFSETMASAYDQLRKMPTRPLVELAKMGDRLSRLLPGGGKKGAAGADGKQSAAGARDKKSGGA